MACLKYNTALQSEETEMDCGGLRVGGMWHVDISRKF